MGSIDKKLFTPGPLNCSLSTKEAMLKDLGSRDETFIQTVSDVRRELLEIAGVSEHDWTAVLIQGSGTYAVEAVLQTSTPRGDGRVLILANGAYGLRMETMCKVADLEFDSIRSSEILPFNISQVEAQLTNGKVYTTVCIVHCETSSGVINNVEEVAELVRKHQPLAFMFVDAMSSFGAIPLGLTNIDFLVSSANKCLQGVPGFAYAICRKQCLAKCAGNSRSLSLDLEHQERNMIETRQFRFTPPTHTILAFKQALQEFKAEGGLQGRGDRYAANCQIMKRGMIKLGFKSLVKDEYASNIISCFFYPDHENFKFKTFYTALSDKGEIIYPGKVTDSQCFRIGNIGDLHKQDMDRLLVSVEAVLKEMEIPVPVPGPVL
ncbi:uncharacterized protein LOC111715037 [Eurytemora carolleeae]|uniref:uncharacterized protein LOC111715037 n=1 Tax=Eurytemora carolleeae TaxID=1294199 RepID=UPI000C7710AB|nr:uncharacterized protein LOC111715037 [Eurytemora carolleeae]|eukprot:XP_023346043.1 uncharacterized protein LOC111715037 [Eurytemora affinis]